MRAERAALVVMIAAAGGVGAATPVAEPLDPEMIEFLAEFSAKDGFVDPFALDKVGKAVDEELKKLDVEAKKAALAVEKPAAKPGPVPPAKKEDDDGH